MFLEIKVGIHHKIFIILITNHKHLTKQKKLSHLISMHIDISIDSDYYTMEEFEINHILNE
jgi:hypothetical protein